MINPKTPLTGIIEADNKKYNFYLNGYSMVFMDSVVNSYITSNYTPTDGFMTAMSHNGYKILFPIGQHDFPITNTMKWGFSSYIVSNSNVFDYDLSYYDGIIFVGGTLSKLKYPRGMNTKYDEENQRDYIEYNDDTQNIHFCTDEFNCDVSIASSISEHYDNESKSITNGKIYFQMVFDKKQVTSTVYKHYGKICELLAFLTNRQNVGFDEIYLLQKSTPTGPSRVAQVFLKQSKNLTKKNQYNNLEFELLGDSMTNMLQILYNTKERKKSYSLNIYPENDESDTLVTNEMIRGVCSALECEIKFVKGIKNVEEKKILDLKKKLQLIIDEHKKSADKLNDKTYSLIESSMSHWSMAASDQIKALFHMYDEELTIANKSSIVIGDKEIDDFVKYRNDITHGSYRALNRKIAYTTYLLSCLVYCCVLTRIGIPRNIIKQWFQDGRLLR